MIILRSYIFYISYADSEIVSVGNIRRGGKCMDGERSGRILQGGGSVRRDENGNIYIQFIHIVCTPTHSNK